MHFTICSLLLAFIFTPIYAQITAAFTDPITNITFQRFFGAKTSFAFGIALPQNPTTDFIGQISCPCPSSTCWGGISLADDMVGPLLLAAWPNGNSIQSSFRLAETEDASPPVAAGNFSVVPIPQGTSANGTHMLFTFLCQNCIDSKLGFAASDTNAGVFEMGWALADTTVSNSADPAAQLTFHNKGMSGLGRRFENFVVDNGLNRIRLFWCPVESGEECELWWMGCLGGCAEQWVNDTSSCCHAGDWNWVWWWWWWWWCWRRRRRWWLN